MGDCTSNIECCLSLGGATLVVGKEMVVVKEAKAKETGHA